MSVSPSNTPNSTGEKSSQRVLHLLDDPSPKRTTPKPHVFLGVSSSSSSYRRKENSTMDANKIIINSIQRVSRKLSLDAIKANGSNKPLQIAISSSSSDSDEESQIKKIRREIPLSSESDVSDDEKSPGKNVKEVHVTGSDSDSSVCLPKKGVKPTSAPKRRYEESDSEPGESLTTKQVCFAFFIVTLRVSV